MITSHRKKTNAKTLPFSLILAFILISTFAWSQAQEGLTISFSDGRPDVFGIKNVNSILSDIGVRVSTVNLPNQAKAILNTSKHRALNKEEVEKLIHIFYLNRRDLLAQIEKAGRKPEAHRGGFLSTKEEQMSPYPKVYDMKALTPEVTVFLQEKFGKLHVNSSTNGVGIDEVMTIISGGPWTWFFVLSNNVVAKLTLRLDDMNDTGWRLSYPGLIPHGGFFDAEYGLVVAFAHGPEKFVMRYEESTIENNKWMGDNPWIDFTSETPKLLDRIR